MKTSIMNILYQLEQAAWMKTLSKSPWGFGDDAHIKIGIIDTDGLTHQVDLVGVVSHAERCNFSLRSSDSIQTVPIIKDGEVKVQFMTVSTDSASFDGYLKIDEEDQGQTLTKDSEVLILFHDRPVYDLMPLDEYKFFELYQEERMTSLKIKALNQIKKERTPPTPKSEKSERSRYPKETVPTKEVACLYYEINSDFDDSSVLEGILAGYRTSSDEDIETGLKYFRASQTHMRFMLRYYTYCYEFTGSVKWGLEKPMPRSKKKVLRESTIYDGSLIRRIAWADQVSV